MPCLPEIFFVQAPAVASASVTITGSDAYAFDAPRGSGGVITFDKGGAPYVLTGAGKVVSGSQSGVYAAPGLSGGVDDASSYLAAFPSGDAPEAILSGFGGLFRAVSLYWGSIDSYNTLDLFSGGSLVGSVTGGEVSSWANGDQDSGVTNRRVSLLSDVAFDAIGFRTGSNAFEVDNVSLAAAVPEPASWALMILGFGAAGAALRTGRRRVAFAA
jgi:hypothetical protein